MMGSDNIATLNAAVSMKPFKNGGIFTITITLITWMEGPLVDTGGGRYIGGRGHLAALT